VRELQERGEREKQNIINTATHETLGS